MKQLKYQEIVLDAIKTYLDKNLEEDHPFRIYRNTRCLLSGRQMVYHDGKLYWCAFNGGKYIATPASRQDYDLLSSNDIFIEYANMMSDKVVQGEVRKVLDAFYTLGYEYLMLVTKEDSRYELTAGDIEGRCIDGYIKGELPDIIKNNPTVPKNIATLLVMGKPCEIIYKEE